MTYEPSTLKELANPTIFNKTLDEYQFIFAHIPRTGGKTLSYIINKNCQDKLVFTHHFIDTKEIYNQNLYDIDMS